MTRFFKPQLDYTFFIHNFLGILCGYLNALSIILSVHFRLLATILLFISAFINAVYFVYQSLEIENIYSKIQDIFLEFLTPEILSTVSFLFISNFINITPKFLH